MSSETETLKAKYKALLVAYKDLSSEESKKLNYYFISMINSPSDLKYNKRCGDYKTSAGLAYRTCLYHTWFKNNISEKLKKEYSLGIVEIRIGDYDKKEDIIKQMEKDHKGNIIIADEAAL